MSPKKRRQKGQNRADEIDRDELKAKLLEKEMAHFKKIGREEAVNNKEAIKHAQIDDGEIHGGTAALEVSPLGG